MGAPAPVVEPWRASDDPLLVLLATRCGLTLDVAAERARSWARVWVARATPEGDPIGFLLAWAVADELHVIDLATDPSARRRRVGTALVRCLLAQARSEPFRLVLLEVRRSNRAAIGLYRAQGFMLAAVRRDYYRDPTEDAIEMRIELDPTTGLVVQRDDEVDLTEP